MSPQRRLALHRLVARAALGWEALWPALLPVLGASGAGAVLALLDLPALLPGWLHLVLLLAWALAVGYAAWRGFRRFPWPDAAAADRRLEADSGLAHRPLQVLADRPTGSDPMALALWAVHQRHAAGALARLRLRPPEPGMARRDPRALRAALALALVAALVVAGEDAAHRLWRGLTPHLAGGAPAPALKLEAWATPPAYTGAAPIFLPATGGAVRLPAGSTVQLALSGGAGGVPELARGAQAAPFQALGAGSFAAEAQVAEDGPLAVRRDGRAIVAWALSVQPDAPPTAEFTEPPARAQRGTALRLPWQAGDDWGLAQVQAQLRLAARPAAPPLTLDLPLPAGRPRQAHGAANPDLSAHPWAGLEVVAQLVARDGAGQQGVSGTARLVLPERSFNHPVARRLIAVRKGLSLDPAAREAARQELDATSAAPEAFEHDSGTYLALRSARHRLEHDRRAEAVDEVQALLWETAVALEEGRDGRTQRALQQAQEAVREAIREAEQHPEDAARRAELERRIQDLREAIHRHLEALADRLQRENAEALPYDPQQRLADQRRMDRQTRRMEQAAREGRTEDAERQLAELEEMLKALQEGRTDPRRNADRQQRRERGQQSQGVVQDMVRRESDMLDRSHQREQAEERRRAEQRRQQLRQRPNGLRWPFEPPPPEAGPEPDAQAQAERSQDARRQRALRRALGELMQQFGDLAGQVPEALGRADQAMRDSQEALGEGRDPREPQQRALRALQEGGRQMAQMMQRQMGQAQPGEEEEGEGDDLADGQPGQGGDQDGAEEQGEGRDPLGRRHRELTGSNENGNDTRVPDEAEQLRTRRIQEELRRREAEKQRPAEELDYIERLLKRF